MADPDAPGPILSPAEAKKRFLLYVLLKFFGLGALFAGALLGRDGPMPLAIIVMLAGASSLLLRPKHIGLTTRPER